MAMPYPLPPFLNARGRKEQEGLMQGYLLIEEMVITFILALGFSIKGHLIHLYIKF